jgi:hypothetical protein
LLKIVEYANENDDVEIIIKPRVKLDKDTLHNPSYHVENLLPKTLPLNLKINHQDIYEIASKVDIVATVSSTFAMEAIKNNIPTVIISDVGYTDFFRDSNIVKKFSSIKSFKSKINLKWNMKNKFQKNKRFNLIIKEKFKKESMGSHEYEKLKNYMSVDRTLLLKRKYTVVSSYLLLFRTYLKHLNEHLKTFIKKNI